MAAPTTTPWARVGLTRRQYYEEKEEAEREGYIRQHPPPKPPPPLSERLKGVWDEVNALVRESGGAVVSQPYTDPVILECGFDSDLPEVFGFCGFCVVPNGTNTRLMPVSGGVGPTTVAVFLLRLEPPE